MFDKKVLVVDHEIPIVQVIAVKLRNNGFNVITSENSTEAFELACKYNPDIIVTDTQMPEMSGLELVQRLRENPETSDIYVVLLTARGFAIEDQQIEELNISACLSKPFSPKELLQTVKEILHQNILV